MSWEYTRDRRTDQKVHVDYELGKKYERIVFDKLLCKKFLVNDDTFKTLSPYSPDCFLLIDKWYPVEIKYSQVELQYVELKKNQADLLAEINGLYLQSTPTKYVLLDAQDIVAKCMVVEGYCHKPCYKFTNPNWILWDRPLEK